MVCDLLSEIDLRCSLEAGPTGDTVDLNHRIPFTSPKQIDPGIIGLKQPTGLDTECRRFLIHDDRLRLRALRDVVPPPIRPAAHGRDHPIPYHQTPEIVIAMWNKLLDVEDAPSQHEGAKDSIGDIGVTDPHHPSPTGAKERLHHHVTKFAERLHRLVEPLSHHRPWGRQAA